MAFQVIGKPIMAVAAIALVSLTPLGAAAQGDACASQLTPDGKTIYAAALAANPTLPTLRETMTTVTKGLAAAGKIAPAGAQDNGAAAGRCMAVDLRAKASPTVPNANVPTWAIGNWRGTLRGPNSYWFSGYRLDQTLIVRPDGSCRFGGLPDRVYEGQCIYGDGKLTAIALSGARAELQYRNGQLSGPFEGGGFFVDLTMSKQ